MMSRILALLMALAAAAVPSAALSTLAPPTTVKQQQPIKPSGTFFAAPLLAPFQRASLKQKLIRAADQKNEALILSLVEQLAEFNPTDCPTRGLMGYMNGKGSTKPGGAAPLNGKWRLLYTNARDAEAPARTNKNQKEEPFGDGVATGVDVKTGQRIDASLGQCVNYIALQGDQRPFDQLEITIKMTPLSEKRVRLDFLTARVQNAKAPLPFLKDVTLNFPPAALGDFVARLRGNDPNVEPQAYFDVLYIDGELRAHRTGEGKIFVQVRDKKK
jgi:hypothetical protein